MAKAHFLSVLGQQPPTRRTALLTGMAALCAACGGASGRDAGGGFDAQTSDADARPDAGADPDVVTDPDVTEGPDADAPDQGMMSVTCDPNFVPAGNASEYTVNARARFFASDSFFVLRDAMGFYAVTSICTHRGCDVAVSGAGYRCPCHGATYSRDGSNPGSPAFAPLRNWAVCIGTDGGIFVDTANPVPLGTRANPP